jgi:CubicO group peptidase (beta-lactamase class C family)
MDLLTMSAGFSREEMLPFDDPRNDNINMFNNGDWIREMTISGNGITKVITAEGAGGQRLYIFPEYDLLIAFTERNYTTPQVTPYL